MDQQKLKHTEDLVTKAKTRLVIHEPFFASILLRRKIIYTDAVPTLGVDPRAQIYVNPEFGSQLSVDQMVFALAHEVMHIVCMHPLRMGHRNKMKWNYAGDAVINDILQEAKVGEFIRGCVDMKGSKEKTTEVVYDELPEQPPQMGGTGADLMDGDGNLSEADKTAIEAQVRIEISQAAQAAKMAGKLPAGIERMVEEILEVKTPWYEILERFMVEQAKTDYSWARPNRRMLASSIYLPSMDSQSAMGPLVLGIDTSGSIGDRELAYFAGHLNRIIEQARPEKVHIVYCDAAINRTDEATPDEYPVHLKAVGGGGTDLREIFDWVDENDIKPACQIILTDGFSPWPDSVEYPTIILCTTDTAIPIGEVVRFELED